MMAMAKKEDKLVARGLRMEGWSYSQIAEELGVSKGSAHLWCHDIELTTEQKIANKERQNPPGKQNKGSQRNQANALADRKQYQELGRIKARERSRLHMIACMLYWAEGAKSNRHAIIFANSDSEMIQVFIQFLREEFAVAEEKLKVKIHCHTQIPEEIEAIEEYWLDLLNLSRDNLQKTQIVKSSGRSKNRLDYGICTLIVQSTKLLQHIFGAIQEYGNFENEDWLY